MRLNRRKTKRAGTFRSFFEGKVASALSRAGVPYRYEEDKIRFVQPSKNRLYNPDFSLPNGIILEAKGLFDADDRQKHLWIKEQFPTLDIRFVFQYPYNALYKGSKKSYADWCDKHGFKWCHGPAIPESWLNE